MNDLIVSIFFDGLRLLVVILYLMLLFMFIFLFIIVLVTFCNISYISVNKFGRRSESIDLICEFMLF